MAEKFKRQGGETLKGEVSIGGAKNAVLKLLAATILVKGKTKIYNVPQLTDVEIMLNVLSDLGASYIYDKKEKSVEIDASTISSITAKYELVSKMRASFIILGALMSRCREAIVALPGGCAIGERRVDFHIKGLEALGATIKIENGYVHAKASRLIGTEIYLDIPSVGATENLMMAGVGAKGKTIIRNCAREPEIVDLQNVLKKMGAKIKGAGTETIIVEKSDLTKINEISYTPIPDRIIAGTYLLAVASCGGKVEICNVLPKHLHSLLNKLQNTA